MVKVTVRADDDFWNEFDQYWRDQGYESRSDAIRDILGEAVDHQLTDLEELRVGFRNYSAGIAYGDPDLALSGMEILRGVDEELGDIAEEYLEEYDF